MRVRLSRLLPMFLILTLLLAACGGPATPASTATPGAGTGGDGTGVTGGSPVTITFWHIFGGERGEFIQGQIDTFNQQNPEIKVEARIFGSYEDLLTAVRAGSQKNDLPNLFQMYEVGTQLVLDMGITRSAQDLAQENGVDLRVDDFIPTVRNYYTIDGKLNSIPWNSSTPIMYVNMDILKAAGITEVPQTWEDVLAACEKIVSGGHAPKCLTFPLYGWFLEQWMAEMNAPLVNNDNGRNGRATDVLLDSEPAIRIASFIKDLNDGGYLLYSGKVADWDGANAALISKQVAFEISSTSEVAALTKESTNAGFEMQTAYMPIPADVERNGVIVGGGSIWVVDGFTPQETAAALKFAVYMSETEQMAAWHKATGYFPVRQSAADMLTEEGWFKENPNFVTAFDQLLETKANFSSGGAVMGPFNEVRTIMETGLEKIIISGADPSTAMKDANTAADTALSSYNQSVR